MKFIVRPQNPRRLLSAIAIVALMHSLPLSADTLAQGGGYELRPQVVGAGGTTMHGGTWTLDGTVAQVDAFVQNGSAGLRLEGGFWPGVQGAVISDRIFASGFDP